MTERRGVEQRRLDLLQSDSSLYDYLRALELARRLDILGDRLARLDGELNNHGAANICWLEADRARGAAADLRRQQPDSVDAGVLPPDGPPPAP